MARYVIRGGQVGYDRLRILARARARDTSDLLDRAGVRAGMRCIDLGCGGGDVTLEIAQRVGPEGRVTGVEMDEVKLRLARETAEERGLVNVEFRVADVDEWNEDDAFDLVYSRFLLEHVGDPLGLARRMWAAVRPGGAIAVEDGDFDGLFCEPPSAGYAFFADMYRRVLVRHGGDPTIGRKLYRYFLEIGVPDPEVRLVQDTHKSGDAKAMPLLTLEATADAIRSEGLATDDELDEALAGLATFTDDPGDAPLRPACLSGLGPTPARLGGFGEIVLVAGVRWAPRGKDAGSLNTREYWGDRGRGLGTIQRGPAAQRLFRQALLCVTASASRRSRRTSHPS